MNTTSAKRAALGCALLASTALATTAHAQTARDFRQIDENGVDLVHGDFVMSFNEGSIGSGPAELALIRHSGQTQGSQWDRYTFWRTFDGSTVTIVVGLPGGSKDRFTGASFSTSFTAAKANGATLTKSGFDYLYVAPDGTEIRFVDPTGSAETESPPNSFCSDPAQSQCDMLPDTITSPNGHTVSFFWELYAMPDGTGGTSYEYRLDTVSNSYGYEIDFLYQDNNQQWGSPPSAGWKTRTGAQFKNAAVSANAQASVSYAYPSGATAGTVDVTDMAGNVWRVTSSSIRRPGEANPGFSVAMTSGQVTSVVKDGVTTNYSRVVSGSTATVTVTNALNQQTVIESNTGVGRPSSVTDALGNKTSFTYDANNRLTRVTEPEGNYVQYTLDARGNRTQTQRVAKSGSGAPTITTSAAFAATCSNPKTCNSPTSTTDARGNVTDYAYDTTHGGVTSVTAPAAPNGVRPQKRLSYTLLNGEYQLTGVSACQTQSSCAGTADEVKSTISYDAQGNVVSASSGNGSGSLTATQVMTYTAMGDLATVDGPLAGTADTSRFRYDAARRLVGTVSPDPDGTGALKHRAQRSTFDAARRLVKIESGTVNSQSDADWTNFAPAEAVETTYASNRPVISKLVSGGTVHALTQTSYDALGRPDCTAVRMNPAEFGSLPASACTLDTPGSFGPDRITKTVYDAARQVTQVRTAVGTTLEAAEASTTYTGNGRVQTLTDAENNRTTYEYDGHDRLLKTRYPVPTKGANASSTTDYEQLGYDAGSNVTSFRNRAGEVIAFGYDNLSRMTSKNLPGTEPDVSYGHDNLGRLKSASQTGNALSFTYDALGRNLTQAGPHGTVSSAYDPAGRRTRITYPGSGLYVDHDYLVTGEVRRIRENGATSGIGVLATFGYDDRGRRTSITRGNGTVTSYAYDAASRLDALTQNVANTANDLTLGFDYNPAGQITSNTRSNDAYAWTGHGSGTTDSTANGLNQLVTQGGAALTYDARGNMTSDGTKSYGYSSENLLKSATGATLGYDPAMRLYQVAGTATTRFAYDGVDLIAEYNGSNSLLRRYVHGPGVDEPLVQYEGSGTSDRRFLHADERGSIVAASDSAGGTIGVNRYDEYGKPAASNIGRFQYTGQKWIGEVGLYDYKTRMYHPVLPRFMQTDRIGYGDGMNFYAYVKGDPVNRVDPTGLSGHCTSQTINHWSRLVYASSGEPVPGDIPRYEGSSSVSLCAENSSDGILVIGRRGGGAGRNRRSAPNAPYTDESPQEQMDNCRSNPATRRALRDSGVRARIRESFRRSYSAPRTIGFWEHGFWARTRGGVHAFGVGTDKGYDYISPDNQRPYWFTEAWFGTPDVFFHTHNGEVLSNRDVNWAEDAGVSVVALNPGGGHYCFPGAEE